MTRGLWEGARRLPYFFTVKTTAVVPEGNEGLTKDVQEDWIFCPQCALAHAPEAEPHYVTLRSLMCCRCGVLMGPINKAETEEVA
jgi:hypothetical protein